MRKISVATGFSAIFALALTLAGCQGGTERGGTSQGGRVSQGEQSQGTISEQQPGAAATPTSTPGAMSYGSSGSSS